MVTVHECQKDSLISNLEIRLNDMVKVYSLISTVKISAAFPRAILGLEIAVFENVLESIRCAGTF